jgi:DNA invertase Pin-like site-specific DNA recombinase
MTRKSSSYSSPNGAAVIRCAIYTRKSSEEGLNQEFNSLDAQREACEAYIRSQKSAGWVALPEMYDDGGISGGTMDRPALQRLLTDIAADRIDTVVVYKVDRLTRSLRDFAKIVDAFDAKNVSFVSVTQQFNTTTSMGRLTLNMLLSFAQFEREVTGERIRDKIAASKQKGMWMGGLPPLGYDVADRKLAVNATEAEVVCHIYRRYTDLKSVHALKLELDASGIVSKARRDRNGNPTGRVPIAVGALYHILQNRLYRGEIVHKDKAYPGQHAAIIDQVLWDEVQAILAGNRIERAVRSKAADPSLLAGLVFDARGDPMSPTHAVKTRRGVGGAAAPHQRGTRYRYYVSQSLIKGGRDKPPEGACRVPAADLEHLVADRICGFVKDPAAMLELAGTSTVATQKALIEQAADFAQRWPHLSPSEKRGILGACLSRIEVRAETVEIALRPLRLREVIRGKQNPRRPDDVDTKPSTVLTVPARVKRTGMANKLVIDGQTEIAGKPNRSLVRSIAQARYFSDLVATSRGRSIKDLAVEAGVSPSYFTRVFRLSFLAPDITKAILQGRHPAEFTAIKLMRAGQLALCWTEQRRGFGFDGPGQCL